MSRPASAAASNATDLQPPTRRAGERRWNPEIWGELSEILADMQARGPSVFEGDDPFAELRPRLAEVGLTDC